MDIQKGHILTVNPNVPIDLAGTEVLATGQPAPDLVEISTGGLTHRQVIHRNNFLAPVSSPTPLMRRLAHSFAGAKERLEEAHEALESAQRTHREEKREMRDRLIGLHQEKKLDRHDLDTFLSEFELEPYARPWRGTMTVTFEVVVQDARDQDDAENQAFGWLAEALHGHRGRKADEDVILIDDSLYRYNLAEDLA